MDPLQKDPKSKIPPSICESPDTVTRHKKRTYEEAFGCKFLDDSSCQTVPKKRLLESASMQGCTSIVADYRRGIDHLTNQDSNFKQVQPYPSQTEKMNSLPLSFLA